MAYEELMNKMENQEEVYFENSFDEVAFMANPKDGYLAKRKNDEPFKVELGNRILTDALLEGKIMTKDEFDNY